MTMPYLPMFAKHQPFTVQELLHHTAGIHDDQESPPLPTGTAQVALATAIAHQNRLFDFPPGTAWLYSNANYVLLGALIEAVTRTSLAEAIATTISTPLRLTRTAMDASAEVLSGRAAGYTQREGQKPPAFQHAMWVDIGQAGGAGAMRSTAADLARWHQQLQFGPFLTRAERELFLAAGTLRDGRPASAQRFSPADSAMGETQYGFGVHLDRSGKDRGLIVHHNGFINGFSSYLATHMPSRTTIACLCNIDPHPGLPFREIRKRVFPG
jgi:D-alanyl-D-alanine carboxypeptidase